MNKKLFLSLAAGAIALFQACSGDVVELDENAQQPIQTKAKLTVTVHDAVKGIALDADVSLNDGTAQKASKTTGATVFEDVGTGTHQLHIKLADYAEMFETATVSPATQQNIYIAKDTTVSVQLLPLTAGLSGYIKYVGKDGAEKAAEGVTVYIQLNDTRLANRIIKAPTKTDATGKYTFDKLPAPANGTSNYSLWAEGIELDDIPFGTITVDSYVPLQAGITNFNSTTAIFESTNNTAAFAVKSYDNIIDYNKETETGKLVFVFNAKIDPEYWSASMVTLSNSAAADFKWSKTNDTLTIIPAGKWAGGSFNVQFNGLKSQNGKILYDNYPIIVLHKDVSGIAIAPQLRTERETIGHLGSTITLKWEKVKGVNEAVNVSDGYQVYRKVTGLDQDGYMPITASGPSYLSDSVTVTVATGTINHREVCFLVQGGNPTFKTILDETKAVCVKDEKKPTLSDWFTSITWTSTDKSYHLSMSSLTSASANTNAEFGYFQFSEPMDTTSATGALAASGDGRAALIAKIDGGADGIKLKWATGCLETASPSTTYLYICAKVKADNVISSADVEYTISGVKDAQGNKYEQKDAEENVVWDGKIVTRFSL